MNPSERTHRSHARESVLACVSGATRSGYGGVEGAWNGPEYQVAQRLMMEGGTYLRIGQLGPESPPEALGADYGWRYGDAARRQAPHQPATRPEIRNRYEGLEPPWRKPEGPKFPRER